DLHGAQAVYVRLSPNRMTGIREALIATSGRVHYMSGGNEPPWVCRRLQPLRDWSHDESEKVLPRGAGAGGSDGVRARERVLLAVGCHPVYCRKDRLLW